MIEVDQRAAAALTLPPPNAGEIAVDLSAFGGQIVETRLRNEHPEWSDDQVRRAMWEFWSQRPGAPHGDVPGGRLRA